MSQPEPTQPKHEARRQAYERIRRLLADRADLHPQATVEVSLADLRALLTD